NHDFQTQQIELDNALVAPENRRVIGKCYMRINPGMKPKEPTYQVTLDALALTTCYPTFLITAEVPVSGKAFDEPPTDPHVDTQVYGAILPQAMMNQALLDSVAYKTYHAIASGVEPPISRKS
ncbi:hypothetical protein Tco_0461927, partial [Tanacetum coccineum]